MKNTIANTHILTSAPYNELLYRDEMPLYQIFNPGSADFNLFGRKKCKHCGKVFASKDRMDYSKGTGHYCYVKTLSATRRMLEETSINIPCCKGCYKKLQEAA